MSIESFDSLLESNPLALSEAQVDYGTGHGSLEEGAAGAHFDEADELLDSTLESAMVLDAW